MPNLIESDGYKNDMNPIILPDRAGERAQYDKQYRAKRKVRKQQLVDLHNEVLHRERKQNPKFAFGFTKRRLLRSGEVVQLPHEFAFILKACEEFIDNPQRFPALFAHGGAGIQNIQARKLIAKVLACILPNTELIGGRVGLPTLAGLNTISYNQLQEDYALRWGEVIAPSSFANAMKYLRRAGYFHSENINVCVDKSEGTVRGAPGYKQFNASFFQDLKVTMHKAICDLIIASRERAAEKGLRFDWLSYRIIASGVQDIFNAARLNDSSRITQKWLSWRQEQLDLQRFNTPPH